MSRLFNLQRLQLSRCVVRLAGRRRSHEVLCNPVPRATSLYWRRGHASGLPPDIFQSSSQRPFPHSRLKRRFSQVATNGCFSHDWHGSGMHPLLVVRNTETGSLWLTANMRVESKQAIFKFQPKQSISACKFQAENLKTFASGFGPCTTQQKQSVAQ